MSCARCERSTALAEVEGQQRGHRHLLVAALGDGGAVALLVRFQAVERGMSAVDIQPRHLPRSTKSKRGWGKWCARGRKCCRTAGVCVNVTAK